MSLLYAESKVPECCQWDVLTWAPCLGKQWMAGHGVQEQKFNRVNEIMDGQHALQQVEML